MHLLKKNARTENKATKILLCPLWWLFLIDFQYDYHHLESRYNSCNTKSHSTHQTKKNTTITRSISPTNLKPLCAPREVCKEPIAGWMWPTDRAGYTEPFLLGQHRGGRVENSSHLRTMRFMIRRTSPFPRRPHCMYFAPAGYWKNWQVMRLHSRSEIVVEIDLNGRVCVHGWRKEFIYCNRIVWRHKAGLEF